MTNKKNDNLEAAIKTLTKFVTVDGASEDVEVLTAALKAVVKAARANKK